MCDETIHQGLVEDTLSRRTFIATAAAAASTPAFAAETVTATDVIIQTPDGKADAVLFHPKGEKRHPAVLLWPDILGLRPVFRDMGSRLAALGYVVLVPNPFYRSKPAPVVSGSFDFADPAQRATVFSYRGAMPDPGIATDAIAYLGFLDAQPQTNTAAPAGVQGYCMGGELAIRTAAAVPGRIAAVASFHGGNGLASDKPNSPDKLIPQTRASFLMLEAANDDAKDPSVKDKLKAAFAAAHLPADVEVYAANHGWCVKGNAAYDEAEAERAWAALTQFYRHSLA